MARVEHTQRASDKWQCVCDEAMRTFPSRTLRCPAIARLEPPHCLQANSAERGTKKAATHGRSVIRRQSKIHFRGTSRATSPTHVHIHPCCRPLLRRLRPEVRRAKRLWRDSLSRSAVKTLREHMYSKHNFARDAPDTSDSTPLTRTWIWASHIASARHSYSPIEVCCCSTSWPRPNRSHVGGLLARSPRLRKVSADKQ